MGRTPKGENTKAAKVSLKLNEMEVNESISKNDLIIEIWGNCDFFITRTFDVMYSKARKQIPEKIFKTQSKTITRIL